MPSRNENTYYQKNKERLNEYRKNFYIKQRYGFKTDEEVEAYRRNRHLYNTIYKNRDELNVDMVNKILMNSRFSLVRPT